MNELSHLDEATLRGVTRASQIQQVKVWLCDFRGQVNQTYGSQQEGGKVKLSSTLASFKLCGFELTGAAA